MFPNLYSKDLILGLLIKNNYDDKLVIEYLTNLIKNEMSLKTNF